MLNSIQNILRENVDLSDVGFPQKEEDVLRAEEELGVKFPFSYREYLKKWGWLSFGPNEYQGLGNSVNNVVQTTHRVRKARGLPAYFIVVCDHDGDEYVCLDTSRFNKEECPVIIWDSPTQSISRSRAKDFAEFLVSDLTDFL